MRLSYKSKHIVTETSGFILFAIFVGTFIWLTHASASRLPDGESEVVIPANALHRSQGKDMGRPSCPHCAPAGDQEIYIPLIDLPEAQGSEIVFNSRSPHAMNVIPTFYSRTEAW